MANALAVNDILEVKTYCWEPTDKQLGINVTHYLVTAVVGLGALDTDMALDLPAFLAPKYKAWLSNLAYYWGLQVQITHPIKLGAQTSPLNRGVGTGGSPMIPTVAAPILTWKTGSPGRGNRGRLYLPFGATASLGNDGQLNGTGVILARNIGDAYLAYTTLPGAGVGNSVSLQLSLFNRTSVTTTAVIDDPVSGKIGRQKRRGDYGRYNTAPVL